MKPILKRFFCFLALLVTLSNLGTLPSLAGSVPVQFATTSGNEASGYFGCVIESKTKRPVFGTILHASPTPSSVGGSGKNLLSAIKGSVLFTTNNITESVQLRPLSQTIKYGQSFGFSVHIPDGGLALVAVGRPVTALTSYKLDAKLFWVDRAVNPIRPRNSQLVTVDIDGKTPTRLLPSGICVDESKFDDQDNLKIFNGGWQSIKARISQYSLSNDNLRDGFFGFVLGVGEILRCLFGGCSIERPGGFQFSP